MPKQKNPRTGQGEGARVAPQNSTATLPDAAPEIKPQSFESIHNAWRKIRAQELSGHHDRRATARLKTELLESVPAWQRLEIMDALNREGGL